MSHAFLREPFNVTTESWDEAQTFASKMDQTQNSMRFKSGDEGGQASLLQKWGKWFLHHPSMIAARLSQIELLLDKL